MINELLSFQNKEREKRKQEENEAENFKQFEENVRNVLQNNEKLIAYHERTINELKNKNEVRNITRINLS